MSYENIFPIRAYAWANALRRAGVPLNVFADSLKAPDDRDRVILTSGEVHRALGRVDASLESTGSRLRVSLPTATSNDLDAMPTFEVFSREGDLLAAWSFPHVPDDLANAVQFELMWLMYDYDRPGRKKRGNNPIPLV